MTRPPAHRHPPWFDRPAHRLRLVAELRRWGALDRLASGDYVIGRRLWDLGLLAPVQSGLRQAASMERAGDALRDADGNTWTPLSLAALVREERFLQVAR